MIGSKADNRLHAISAIPIEHLARAAPKLARAAEGHELLDAEVTQVDAGTQVVPA
jgi:hypothetical protein